MNLMYIDWTLDPVMFSIAGFEFRYYTFMWILAFWAGTLFFNSFTKREGISQEANEAIFIYTILGAMLGARIGHCLFYEPETYLVRPWEIITKIRNGGLASHGAAIGMIIGLWLWSRKYKIAMVWALDRIMIPVGLGGALVRFGNLFNSEIFGYPTTLPWGFKFHRSMLWMRESGGMAVHPTQIYEAIIYLITFGVLALMYYKWDLARRRPALLFGVGMQGIFLSRILVESIKYSQVGFEQGMSLNMGQWLSVPFVLLGAGFIWYSLSREEVKVK
ncbi:MAG: prolipoprotein diacylglyceryl transferase [Rikenellaceae bacterium]